MFLEGGRWIRYPPQEKTALVRTVRLPDEGLYESTLTCITVG